MAKILVVEDDSKYASILEEFLTFEEHTLDIVHDGQEASERLRRTQYDLVILDWELPGLSGPEICQGYRQAGGTTPIIMLTGRGSMDDKEHGFDLGADDYLTKPFNLKELSMRIKALLRRSAAAASQPPDKTAPTTTESRYCKICGGYFSASERLCPTDGIELIVATVKIDELVGTTVGERYIVMAMVASGGMGVVYQAWHKFLNRLVAIKLLHTRFLDDPTYLRRFQLEAQSLSTLTHPNIITVCDFGMIGTQPYLVMDFINGRCFADILHEQYPLDTARALNIFTQTCSAVAHAHANGIIHRDLKPSNLMIEQKADGSELVKIVDFGIAKLVPKSEEEVERLTSTGECFGTSYYMSPEQCRGQSLDARSDIYSIGCIMYETLTKEPPFVGDNVLDTFQKHIHQPTMPPSALKSELPIPAPLEALVLKALEKEPNRRHQTADELRLDLEHVVATISV